MVVLFCFTSLALNVNVSCPLDERERERERGLEFSCAVMMITPVEFGLLLLMMKEEVNASKIVNYRGANALRYHRCTILHFKFKIRRCAASSGR